MEWIVECELNNQNNWIERASKIARSYLNTTFIVVGHSQNHWDFGDKYGVCMPKVLSDYFDAPPKVERVFECVGSAYGISIRKDIGQGPKEFMAYVLGHEIGHALICENEGIETHVLSCLVYNYTSQLKDSGNIRYVFDLPGEQFCDLYGKAMASSIFGELSVNQCLENRIRQQQLKGRNHDPYLKWLLKQPAVFQTFSVNDRTRKLFQPYRTELIELWTREREEPEPLDPLVKWPTDYEDLI